jgi:O-6-methylguanine DNA methyltransferase
VYVPPERFAHAAATQAQAFWGFSQCQRATLAESAPEISAREEQQLRNACRRFVARFADARCRIPVGQAMAKNPVALIIPCHRVLAAGGKIGSFSAPGGAETKAKMLALEGVRRRRSRGRWGCEGSRFCESGRSGLCIRRLHAQPRPAT